MTPKPRKARLSPGGVLRGEDVELEPASVGWLLKS